MSASSSRRPAPRRSTLAGSTPAAPPVQPDPAPDQAPESAVVEEPAPKAAGARSTKYPPKVSFYQDPADSDRMRGAILHTMAAEGPRSLSQFIQRAVMAEVARLEGKYNDGAPFPPVGARALPQGRPMGE